MVLARGRQKAFCSKTVLVMGKSVLVTGSLVLARGRLMSMRDMAVSLAVSQSQLGVG